MYEDSTIIFTTDNGGNVGTYGTSKFFFNFCNFLKYSAHSNAVFTQVKLNQYLIFKAIMKAKFSDISSDFLN